MGANSVATSSAVGSAVLCESLDGLVIEAGRAGRGGDENERILELWLGRSYCDSGKRRWNL